MIDKRRLTDVKVTYEVNTILSDLYNQIEYELRDDYNDSLEQLQSNWNNLKEYLEDLGLADVYASEVLDKMKELEGKDMK